MTLTLDYESEATARRRRLRRGFRITLVWLLLGITLYVTGTLLDPATRLIQSVRLQRELASMTRNGVAPEALLAAERVLDSLALLDSQFWPELDFPPPATGPSTLVGIYALKSPDGSIWTVVARTDNPDGGAECMLLDVQSAVYVNAYRSRLRIDWPLIWTPRSYSGNVLNRGFRNGHFEPTKFARRTATFVDPASPCDLIFQFELVSGEAFQIPIVSGDVVGSMSYRFRVSDNGDITRAVEDFDAPDGWKQQAFPVRSSRADEHALSDALLLPTDD